MTAATLVLRELGVADEAAFLAGAAAWQGENLTWHTFDWMPGMAFADLLERLRKNRHGIDLRPGFVPGAMLYGFVGGSIVGRISIRLRLNAFLARSGGHLGFAVAPPFRGRGFATAMVRQGLAACRALGLRRILVTASDGNEPSLRIIERLGGVYEGMVSECGDPTRRYWIDLR
jgi:predicted acetyltransferase